MVGWRIAFGIAHLIQFVLLFTLLKDYHFVDPALYSSVKDTESLNAIHVAAELGRFDLASMFLAGVSLLLGVAAIFGFVEVRWRSEKRAEDAARSFLDQKFGEMFEETMKTRMGPVDGTQTVDFNTEAEVISKASELRG